MVVSQNLRTFALAIRKSLFELPLKRSFWRDVRVVECAGLENRCTERYRGFESLSLRKELNQKWLSSFFVSIHLICDQARHSDVAVTNKYIQQHEAHEYTKHFRRGN